MTMDKSLRVRAGMIRFRNVLTRDERIRHLLQADRWQEGDSPLRPAQGAGLQTCGEAEEKEEEGGRRGRG